ncbi:ADP-glyceromanno-heptose 6-epimerase [Fundidesulfovibrio butyratiphilus]
MHIVTGGAGFLGSAIVWKLNRLGVDDILIVDNLGTGEKWRNLTGLRFADYMDKADFLRRIEDGRDRFGVKAVAHMGACSSTTQRDASYLMENNYRYSLAVARLCLGCGARLVHASSAATYGDGSQGFDDDPAGLDTLRPMNPYGYSKHLFDLAARRHGWLDSIACLKFFNVYGPGEHHKGDMRSVVCKAFEQVRDTGVVRLFRSHRQDYADGRQERDFVYVKDCADVVAWLLDNPQVGGIFNVGTGKARTFYDLTAAVFSALGRPERIEYVDMPEPIRDTYQYHTQATVERLRNAGYAQHFTELEDGVRDYVRRYLANGESHL